MITFAINEARKLPRIGSFAIISGTLLCAAATIGPALSADLPGDYTYRPRYEYYRPSYDRGYGGGYDRGYDRGCYRCSCCGVRRYPPAFERPIAERIPGPMEERERHWVQRDYIERRYPPGPRYYDNGYPGDNRYSYYYPGPADDPPPSRYGGEYPPAPAAYENDGPRSPRFVERPREFRPAYEYEPSPPRTAYDYENSPRPPAPVPGGYYNSGYPE